MFHPEHFVSRKHAKRQIVFKDFSDSISSNDRIQFIESLMDQYKIKFNYIDHFFSGPKNSRKITKKSFVEFHSQQSAIKALEALGGKNKKFEITDSESCTLTTAITAINQKRNWSLRKASELIKESSLSSGKNVEINWKERRVIVDSKEVFLQSNQDLGGRFLNPYDRLKLP